MDCHTFRVRDNNNYDINVEHFIKSLEKQYKIDFRSLPQWKEIIKRLHVTNTTYNQKIQDFNRRKSLIIDKIYVQWCRPSPFELTDKLARTSKKWYKLETEFQKRKISLTSTPEIMCSKVGLEEELPETSETAHQNTEIVPSEDHVDAKLNLDLEYDVKLSESQILPRLPATVCTNQHKYISPLGSKDSALSFKPFPDLALDSESDMNEWLLLNSTSFITCSPEEIIIDDNSSKEQIIKLSIINCAIQYLHIQFKLITETFPFKKTKVLPVTPLRLYPGVAAKFTFIFTLLQNQAEFASKLYFKVGRNVLFNAPLEAFFIPIKSKFKIYRSVTVTETVSVSPIYLWHICDKPKGFVTVTVNDNSSYDLRILKRAVDFTKEFDSSLLSMEVIAPNSESLLQRTEDHEMESQSNIWSTNSKGGRLEGEAESITTIDFIGLVVNEIVELAFEPFVFECTYLHLTPHSKRKISVFFSKAQYIGKHQYCYDFEFYDPGTDDIILTKTVKIFAEILPHPIQISPNILNMSDSPITHGFCEDRFVVTNTHKLYPATIKIKLTTKMKKLFQVTPMEATIPAKSSVYFVLKFCSRDFKFMQKSDDLVHLTFKIIFVGHKSIYYNVPPFFYEIIAPCSMEFKKIYSDKYFKQVTENSQIEINNNEQI